MALATWLCANTYAADKTDDCPPPEAFIIMAPVDQFGAGNVEYLWNSSGSAPESTPGMSSSFCGGAYNFKFTGSRCVDPTNVQVVVSISPSNAITGGSTSCLDDGSFEISITSLAPGPYTLHLTGSVSELCTNGGTVTTNTASVTAEVDVDKSLSLLTCSTCSSQSPPASGTSSFSVNGCLNFAVGLGQADMLNGAGLISLKAEVASASLATPAALNVPFTNPNVTIITNSDGLRQVNAPFALADVVITTNNYAYKINLYSSNEVTGFSGGLYTVGTNLPFVTYVINNPDTSNAYNRLFITEQRPGLSDRSFQYTYTSASNRWDLLQPDGTTVSKWYTTNATNVAMTNYFWQTSVGTNVLKQTEADTIFLQGLLLTNQIVEGAGSLTETTTFTYYPTNAAVGSSNMLRRVDYPDGNWEYRVYDSASRVIKSYTPFGNSAPPTDVTQEPDVVSNKCKLTTYAFSLSNSPDSISDDGLTQPNTARKVIVSLPYFDGSSWSEQEISRVYRHLTPPGGYLEEQVCTIPGATWGDSNSLVTITYSYDSDPTNSSAASAGRVKSISRPDGTATYYTYSKTSTTFTTVESIGAPDGWSGPSAITNGTKTTTVLDQWGRISSKTVKVITNSADGATLGSDGYTYATNDATGRNYTLVDLAGRTWIYDYACCGLDTINNPDGVVTSYTYDAMKRPLTVAVTQGNPANLLFVTTSNVYDALGRAAVVQRIGTNGSVITNDQLLYDVLGRVALETNALNGVTTNTNVIVSNQRCITNSYPDGGTRIQKYYRDGQLQTLTGTAVQPVRYTNFVVLDSGSNVLVQQAIKLDTSYTDTSEWTKTYLDLAGRPYKTVYSAASTAPAAYSYYNLGGQLTNQVDPDGVSTFYAYNDKGERAYTIIDTNQNGTIDWTGPDRITFTTNDVATDFGTNVNRTQTYLCESAGNSNLTLIATVEQSTDGLKSWNTIWNNGTAVTSSNMVAYGSSGYRYQTNFAPDGSFSVNTFQYGQLLSVTTSDSGSNQVGQTSYSYDAFGRQNLITDARTGTTTNFFNNMDQISGTATPSPGSGQSSEVTSNYFDNMGRAISNKLADATFVTNEFYATGTVKRNYGSRTYAAGNGYDAQGRMTKLTNWSSFSLSSPSGARVTTWNYDAYRGTLSSKVYDDGKGPNYDYTDATRLKDRTWARHTNTAYTYNKAAGLATVIYNDGTTAGVTNGYDRIGRQTTISNGATVTTLAYNDAGKVISETNSGGVLSGVSVTNGYDNFLRRTVLSVLTNGVAILTVTNNYDAAGRLLRIGDGSNLMAYSYLANSPLISQIVFSNNSSLRMTATKAYDDLNRLLGLTNVNASSTVLSGFAYAYNSANQRALMTNSSGTLWGFGYDKLGQVTSATNLWTEDFDVVTGRQFDYAYDDIGNRTSSDFGGDVGRNNLRSVSYVANNLNQYTSRTNPGYFEVTGSATSPAQVTINGNTAYRHGDYFWGELSITNSSAAVWQGVTNCAILPPGPNGTLTGNQFIPKNAEAFSYDDDGNLTQDGRFTYTWDAENRLISMLSLTNTPTASKLRIGFGYDYKSRRISKKAESFDGTNWTTTVSNLFVYDGWNLVAELNATNKTLIRSYVWGTDLSGSMQGAGGVGGLLSETIYTGPNTGTYYPCYDGNGNVSALVSAGDGTVAATYEYGPFGELIRVTGVAVRDNAFNFSTKYMDGESGLVYYGYRYCSPTLGRWLNRDPEMEKSGEGLYALAYNNTISTIDFIGRCRLCFCDKVTVSIPKEYAVYSILDAQPKESFLGAPIHVHWDVHGNEPDSCKYEQNESGSSKAFLSSPSNPNQIPVASSQGGDYSSDDPNPEHKISQDYIDNFGAHFDPDSITGDWFLHFIPGRFTITYKCTGSDGATVSKTYVLYGPVEAQLPSGNIISHPNILGSISQ